MMPRGCQQTTMEFAGSLTQEFLFIMQMKARPGPGECISGRTLPGAIVTY